MAIDSDVEPEFQTQIDWVKNFVEQEIEPLDQFITVRRDKQGKPLNRKARAALRDHIK